jgi:hypothetical protein
MATLNLIFDGRSFPIAKPSDLRGPESVQVAVFKDFVNSLKTQTPMSVTKGNAASLSLLANEFFLPELAAACAAFATPADAIASLSDRVSQLELRVSSFSKPRGKLEEKIESHDEALNNLRQEVERQRASIDRRLAVVVSRVDELRRDFEKLRREVQAVKHSGLETLRREFEDLKVSVQRLRQDFTRGGSPEPGDSSSEGAKPASRKPAPPVQQQPSPPMARRATPSAPKKPSPSVSSTPQRVEIPMKPAEPIDPSWDKEKQTAIRRANKAKSLDGIIAYLTKKHGGNVHEKGIVTITSKSVPDPRHALANVADFTSDSSFLSSCSEKRWDGDEWVPVHEPGQWVCWDFREMRVRPSHYTLYAWCLDIWVLEGSLDGSSWTVIHDDWTGFQFVRHFPPG